MAMLAVTLPDDAIGIRFVEPKCPLAARVVSLGFTGGFIGSATNESLPRSTSAKRGCRRESAIAGASSTTLCR